MKPLRQDLQQYHYNHLSALSAITSTGGMTADSYSFEHVFPARVAIGIVNEVKGLNRVVYGVASELSARFSQTGHLVGVLGFGEHEFGVP